MTCILAIKSGDDVLFASDLLAVDQQGTISTGVQKVFRRSGWLIGGSGCLGTVQRFVSTVPETGYLLYPKDFQSRIWDMSINNDNDAIWLASDGSHIYEFDRHGAVLEHTPFSAIGCYGIAMGAMSMFNYFVDLGAMDMAETERMARQTMYIAASNYADVGREFKLQWVKRGDE